MKGEENQLDEDLVRALLSGLPVPLSAEEIHSSIGSLCLPGPTRDRRRTSAGLPCRRVHPLVHSSETQRKPRSMEGAELRIHSPCFSLRQFPHLSGLPQPRNARDDRISQRGDLWTQKQLPGTAKSARPIAPDISPKE